jgi:segregation and condensation protein B
MTLEELMLHTEALLFASDKAISPSDVSNIIAEQFADEAINEEKITPCLRAIIEKYDSPFHSFGVFEIGGGYQFLTKKEYHTTIAKLNGDKFIKRLSTAALETLAIIAYKQPITKPDIEHIRGVNCDYSIQKLLEKELIVITGRNEEAVGKPLIYATSKTFMDYLGLNTMDDLPKISELFPHTVEPTSGTEAIPGQEVQMVINEEGDLLEIPVIENAVELYEKSEDTPGADKLESNLDSDIDSETDSETDSDLDSENES